MEDLETREDDWARGVFDRVRTGQREPHWIPDAAAAARLSNRRRFRYQATGALAAAAIVGLSATAFTTLGGGSRQDGGGGVSAVAGTTAWTGLDLTKYLEIDTVGKSDHRGGPQVLSASGLSTISAVLQSMDPGLKHIRTPSGAHQLDVGPNTPGTSNIEIQAKGYWAPNGDISSFPKPFTFFRPTTPFGRVNITPMSPQAGRLVNVPNKPCGLGSLVGDSGVPAPTAWDPCRRSPQSDGSVILISHSVGLAAGSVTVAERVFPDGSSVQIVASTVIGTPSGSSQPGAFVAGPSLDPVPWTDASLLKALSGPDVKGLP